MERRFKGSTLLLVGIFSALAACGGNEAPSTGSATTTLPLRTAPQQVAFPVDGRSVSLVCRGRGRTPVVFIAGGVDPGTKWDPLVAALGSDVLACVFTRPGVAPSDPDPTPVTARSIGTALDGALTRAGFDSPVVLVGHSLGGVTAVVYGADHPDRVAGAVLIDATTHEFVDDPSGTPILVAFGYDPAATAAQVAAVKHWPAVPLAVLTHDPTTAVAAQDFTPDEQVTWTNGQQRYRRLSSKGSLAVVPDSSHDIYVDQPDAVVAEIRDVLERVGHR